jgi:hypothetical protein
MPPARTSRSIQTANDGHTKRTVRVGGVTATRYAS